jgi:hypothetical protein
MSQLNLVKKIISSSLLAASVLNFSPTLFAQTASPLIGTWKGISNSAVLGAGRFHPTEAAKEAAVRFRRVEYQIVIEKEEG